MTLGLHDVYEVAKQADPALSAALKRAREDRNISQEQLAFEAGITASALSRIERGLNDPRWSTVTQLARALEMTVRDLAAAAEAAAERRT